MGYPVQIKFYFTLLWSVAQFTYQAWGQDGLVFLRFYGWRRSQGPWKRGGKQNKQTNEAANIQPTSEQAWSIQQIGIQELIDSESIRCCFVQWIFDWTSVKHIKHFE